MPLYSAINGDAEGNDIRRPGSATSSTRGTRSVHFQSRPAWLELLVMCKISDAVTDRLQAALQ